MTTAEAAAELGVTVRRVQALIGAGRLAASKVGRDWWITPAALDKVRVRPPRGRPRKNPQNSENVR
jgi:excisionase family DNA binding protein